MKNINLQSASALLLVLIVPAITALVGLASCGGGGGGNAGPVSTATASISFPNPNVLTDATSMSVRGTSTSAGSTVVAVRVDDVAATTNDNFATWSANVPLGTGINTISVELEEASGAIRANAAEVEIDQRGVIMVVPDTTDIEPDSDLALVIDPALRALIGIDLISNRTEVLSSNAVGSGPNLFGPRAVASLSSKNLAYIVDGLGELLEVDLITGDRSKLALTGDPVGTILKLTIDESTDELVLLSSSGVFEVNRFTGDASELSDFSDTSQGPVVTFPKGLALDRVSGDIFVNRFDTVFLVDRTTGQRKVISDNNGVGSGISFGFITGMDLDFVTGNLFVIDEALRAVTTVDSKTGDRELLAGQKPGAFPIQPRAIAFDEKQRRVLITDATLDGLVSIGVDDSSLDLFGSSTVATGLPFNSLRALDFTGGSLMAAESGVVSLIEIKLDSGRRTTIADFLIGSGDPFGVLSDTVFDSATNRAVVADSSNDALISVDPLSGDRAQLVDTTSATGIQSPSRFEFVDGNQAIVLDRTIDGLFTLDLNTGNQVTLSIDGDGLGLDFERTIDLVIDEDHGRALVSTGSIKSRIIAVNLATGFRTLFTDGLLPSGGPLIGSASEMVLDKALNRVLIADFIGRQIVAVDLETGLRTIVTGDSVGAGPVLGTHAQLAIDTENRQLYTYATVARAIIAVDLETGDRVMVSK